MSIARMVKAAPLPRRETRTKRGSGGPEPAPTSSLDSTQDSTAVKAIDVISQYIPTEVVTVYVAALAALSDPHTTSRTGQWTLFWAFLALTPCAVWLLYAARAVAATGQKPLAFIFWPKYEMSAATIAFVLWAFTLPETPFSDFAWYKPALATVLLLVGSLILGLCSPVFRRKSS